MEFAGTPSDISPDVLATGRGDAAYGFFSLSAREPDGRDAEYIEWHSLDHRPEQYRLAGIRNTLRLVSTPGCRAVRAASEGEYDAVDHIMMYQFADIGSMGAFAALGAALDRVGRMPLRLPSILYLTGDLAGRVAAPHAVAGADVIPWRPCTGAYLVIEEGLVTPQPLTDIAGVAGAWWYAGATAPPPFGRDARGMQISCYYLDRDPIETGRLIGEQMRRRWRDSPVKPLLAAPFFAIVPFKWGLHVP